MPIQLVKQLRFSNLQRVNREVAKFRMRLEEEKAKMGRNENHS